MSIKNEYLYIGDLFIHRKYLNKISKIVKYDCFEPINKDTVELIRCEITERQMKCKTILNAIIDSNAFADFYPVNEQLFCKNCFKFDSCKDRYPDNSHNQIASNRCFDIDDIDIYEERIEEECLSYVLSEMEELGVL